MGCGVVICVLSFVGWLVKDSMCGCGLVLCCVLWGMLLYLWCLNKNMSGGFYEF